MNVNLRKLITSGLLATLVLSSIAGPALAGDTSVAKRISETFEDMVGFEWGLSQVTRLQVSGVLKGQDEHLFAPGAKVSRQEMAVAVVRLMGAEESAAALPEATVTDLLQDMPDEGLIASWARNAVALLVQQGAVNGFVPFGPDESSTRLETSLLLVKVLGYEAEAKAKMGTVLPFADSDRIPATQIGYVAAATDHKLIGGYDDNTFRPEQGVKRVELAVMLGRADRQKSRRTQSEVLGTVKGVDEAAKALTVRTGEQTELTLFVSDDVAVFLGDKEVSLTDLQAGMKVEVKLNPTGKAVYIEAEAAVSEPAPPVQGTVVTGEIVVLYAPVDGTPGVPARVGVGSVANGAFTLVTYSLPAGAPILVNGQPGQFGDLSVGDSVRLTLVSDAVTQCEVTR